MTTPHEQPADIRQDTRKLRTPEEWVASYLGNGTIGGCFDYAGLQFQDGAEGRPDIIGDTYFVSQYHYVHGKFGMDYALPIGRLQAVIHRGGPIEPSDPAGFAEVDQVLRIGEGILRTSYTLVGGIRVEQEQFFSQVRKNLFVLKADCGCPIEFRFVPIGETPYHYASHFQTEVRERALSGCTVYEIPTNIQTTAVALRQTPNTLFVAVYSSFEQADPAEACAAEIERAERASYEALRAEHVEWWRRYWAESDVRLPHPLGQIWQRANYYIGSSFSNRETHPPLVFGLARVQWPAYFPQDYFYAYENTLSANHPAQAAGTSEFWHSILPHAVAYAERLFGLRGAVYPWTPPVFDWSDYHHDNQTPNNCYFEMHNSAYVAKMVWDYYRYTLDERYLRESAYPVIREIARMYASMTTLDGEPVFRDFGETKPDRSVRAEIPKHRGGGRARIDFTPNASQDEASPPHKPYYFDTLVSAEWTLTLARELAVRLGDAEMQRLCARILDAGYDFERLEFGDTYSVFEGDTRTEDFQKHPVQLNPITWLPIERFFTDPRVLNYHKRRYEICRGYRDATATAWTLGQFMLASCRLRMPEELARDIANIQRCSVMDREYVQTFESSRRSPHFLTTIGLFMQAITETLVQTHTGVAEFFPCLLPEWEGERIEFANLGLPGGFIASGSCEEGRCRVHVSSEFGGPLIHRIGAEASVTTIDTKPGQTYTLAANT